MYIYVHTHVIERKVGRSNSYLWMWLKQRTLNSVVYWRSLPEKNTWGRCTRQHLILLRFLSFWSWRDQASLPLGKDMSHAQKTGMLHHGWVRNHSKWCERSNISTWTNCYRHLFKRSITMARFTHPSTPMFRDGLRFQEKKTTPT